MRMSDKFEKKFGKYAINNLSMVLIICYAFGYLFYWMYPNMLSYLYLNPYEIIFHGQVWRLFTWLVIPPSRFDFFTLLMLYFYYSLGTTLERTWGTYRYNVYIFSGMFFTILGSFLLFAYTLVFMGEGLPIFWETYNTPYSLAPMFSTYYVNMSIYFAFAATYPNMQLLLFFFIPVKIKVLAIIYGALLVFDFITGGLAVKFVIGASLMNFLIFFFSGRGMIHMTPKQAKRRHEFRREVKKTTGATRHKCAICGRTDESNPELEFRFCSKCEGSYEYCQDHLFTHTHIKK